MSSSNILQQEQFLKNILVVVVLTSRKYKYYSRYNFYRENKVSGAYKSIMKPLN